jgi:hypothetical protein
VLFLFIKVEKMQHFRGLIWPRGELNGLHRYVIIGMLVTDKPLDNLDGDQFLLDGHAAGIAEAIETIQQ